MRCPMLALLQGGSSHARRIMDRIDSSLAWRRELLILKCNSIRSGTSMMSPRRSLRGRRLAVARDFRWFSSGALPESCTDSESHVEFSNLAPPYILAHHTSTYMRSFVHPDLRITLSMSWPDCTPYPAGMKHESPVQARERLAIRVRTAWGALPAAWPRAH